MKQYIIITLFGLIPFINFSQSKDATNGFGFVVNSSFNAELYPVRIVPSVIYFKRNNQFELGVGFNPLSRQTQKLLSSEFNYKYFPNGIGKKLNMFFIARLSYVRSTRNNFYPTTYNYLFINGGYGFEIKPSKNMFIGTNVTLGGYTFNKRSETPYTAFESQNLFKEVGLNVAFQFNIGYWF